MSTDNTKSNDHTRPPAYNVTSAFLTETQVRKLFQNKIDRAEILMRAREQFDRLRQED